MGVGGAVCYGSGFAETGDGDLQHELLAAADGMPLLGPTATATSTPSTVWRCGPTSTA